MKIQLINVPYRNAYGSLKKISAVYFPLGLGYIASVLRQNGFAQVDVFDPEAENSNFVEIENRINNFSPEVVGLSFVTVNYAFAQKIAKIIKKINPAILVVAGGIHASALPKETLLENPEIDLVIIGEGEYTFLEICKNVSLKKNINSIPGIAYKNGKKVFFTSLREPLQDLDQLPFPSRDLVDMRNYFAPSHMDIGKKSVTLISSRGCPARCTFCASSIIAGRKFRAHSPEYIIREINFLQEKYGIDHFIFEDDSFTINKERVEKLCKQLIKMKQKIVWSCFGRVTTVDKKLLDLMKKAGCYLIGYGVESGNNAILRKIKKGITKQQCLTAFRISKKAGLRTQGFFMIGHPGDTKETIMETINFAIKLNPSVAFFSPLVAYPGTEIYNDSFKLRINPSEDWSNYSPFGDHLAVKLNDISSGDLKYYCSLAYRKFYLRPKYLLDKLKSISSFEEFKASFLGGCVLLSKSFKWLISNNHE